MGQQTGATQKPSISVWLHVARYIAPVEEMNRAARPAPPDREDGQSSDPKQPVACVVTAQADGFGVAQEIRHMDEKPPHNNGSRRFKPTLPTDPVRFANPGQLNADLLHGYVTVLGECLCSGSVRELLHSALHTGSDVDIHLLCSDDLLCRYPWEFAEFELCPPGTAGEDRISLIRHEPTQTHPAPDPSLSDVLLVDLNAARSEIPDVAARLRGAGVPVRMLRLPTSAQLRRELQRGAALLYLSGHQEHDSTVSLAGEESLSVEDLIEGLRGSGSWAAVLAICDTAAQGSPVTSWAEALVRTGCVEAAVGMNGFIYLDTDSPAFAEGLFAGLLAGKTLASATNDARSSMREQQLFSYGLPVVVTSSSLLPTLFEPGAARHGGATPYRHGVTARRPLQISTLLNYEIGDGRVSTIALDAPARVRVVLDIRSRIDGGWSVDTPESATNRSRALAIRLQQRIDDRGPGQAGWGADTTVREVAVETDPPSMGGRGFRLDGESDARWNEWGVGEQWEECVMAAALAGAADALGWVDEDPPAIRVGALPLDLVVTGLTVEPPPYLSKHGSATTALATIATAVTNLTRRPGEPIEVQKEIRRLVRQRDFVWENNEAMSDAVSHLQMNHDGIVSIGDDGQVVILVSPGSGESMLVELSGAPPPPSPQPAAAARLSRRCPAYVVPATLPDSPEG